LEYKVLDIVDARCNCEGELGN